MTGQLFINGVDAWTQWAAFLEEGSADKLMLPAPAKAFIENKSRSVDGKTVLMTNPRIDERDITLVFCFANNGTIVSNRLASFMAAIMAGKTINGKVCPTEFGVTETHTTYKLVFMSAIDLTSMNNTIGKVAIRLNEPNPTDRGTQA